MNTKQTEPPSGLPLAPCSLLPPILTVEDFRASAANWESATMVSTASDDPGERHRASYYSFREERRMDEARHLFEFDEEGDLLRRTLRASD